MVNIYTCVRHARSDGTKAVMGSIDIAKTTLAEPLDGNYLRGTEVPILYRFNTIDFIKTFSIVIICQIHKVNSISLEQSNN